MVFSSLPFLFRFLPAVLLLYFVAPKSWKNGILFITSLIFYAWGEPKYILIMLFSTIVDYIHGRIIHYLKEKGKIFGAKICVCSSVIINLCVLGFFKYWDFLAGTVNQLLDSSIPVFGLALPIGISFYTFQTMSYSIDVYRGDAKVQQNIISFGAYVTMFPQLIAGPIVQYKTVAEELQSRTVSWHDFSEGAQIFILGLAKKVLLANNIGALWDTISSQQLTTVPVATAWIGMLAYTFQIYFDFSGYSDMAIGLGRIFGFHFPKNFNYPYQATSVTDFWRRWHITLGTWFREYVYIPLGGNKKGLLKQLRNILIVWALTGFWHGASFNFLFWGLYYGVLLIIEKSFLLKKLEKLPKLLSRTITFLLACFGWVIFALTDSTQIFSYFGALFGVHGNAFFDTTTLYYLYNHILLFIVLFIGSTPLPKRLAEKLLKRLEQKNWLCELLRCVVLCALLIICVAYLVDASYNPFLYFRF